MKRVLIALALFVSAPAVAAELTIMVEDASEPFSRADGSGYANDLVRAAFKAFDIDVRFDIVPYARCKRSVEQGVTPACFAMSWSPELIGKVVFSDQPLFEVYADLFHNRKTPPINSTADFPKGAALAIVNGYEYPGLVNTLLQRGVVLEHGADEVSNLRMLARGRVHAAIVMTSDFVGGPLRLKAAGVEDSVVFAYRSGTMKSYIGFSMLHAQGAEARKAFNTGYAKIIKNGTRDKIRDRWMKVVPR